jgi:hypothetical protein
MVGLTTTQKNELNCAVLEYLVKQNYIKTAQQFAEETQIPLPDEATLSATSTIKKDVLERKWTSVVRLKKQVMELEKSNKLLKEEQVCERCESMQEMGVSMGLTSGSKMLGDGLPREPEKYHL